MIWSNAHVRVSSTTLYLSTTAWLVCAPIITACVADDGGGAGARVGAETAAEAEPVPRPFGLIDERRFVRIPYGVADREREEAYVADADGSVALVDLVSGDALAVTAFQGTALAATAGAVIGWARVPGRPNEATIFAAARQGDSLERSWSTVLRMPDWVDVGSTEAGAFSIRATVESDRVVMIWEARTRYTGGAPPPRAVEEASSRRETRAVILDRRSGEILEEREATPPGGTEQDLDPIEAQRAIAYRRDSDWVSGPWRTGTARMLLARPAADSGIVLIRQNDEMAEPEEILLSSHPEAKATLTADGGTVFVHDPGSEGPSWHAFSTETGALLASLPFEPGTESVGLVGGRVLYVVAEDLGTPPVRRRSLRCRDLQTGEQLWVRTLSEEPLRAPPPPPR